MNAGNPMNISYSLNRDYFPYILISMYSLLTAGKGERNLRILLSVDQDLTREDLSPAFPDGFAFSGLHPGSQMAAFPDRAPLCIG